jgi:hypothetical protein
MSESDVRRARLDVTPAVLQDEQGKNLHYLGLTKGLRDATEIVWDGRRFARTMLRSPAGMVRFVLVPKESDKP